MDRQLTWLAFSVLLMMMASVIQPGDAQQQQGFFTALFNSWANLFRRNNNNNSTASDLESLFDLSSVAVSTVYADPVYLTDTVTVVETQTEFATTTEVSTLSLSWIRWETTTETISFTETLTTTSTTTDVSLLVSVAVVTLTEKTSIFQTMTEVSTTTLFFDRTLTSTQTVLTAITSTCPPVEKIKTNNNNLGLNGDEELVRNLLLMPSIVEPVETTIAPTDLMDKRSGGDVPGIESSFTTFRRKAMTPHFTATADLIFTEY